MESVSKPEHEERGESASTKLPGKQGASAPCTPREREHICQSLSFETDSQGGKGALPCATQQRTRSGSILANGFLNMPLVRVYQVCVCERGSRVSERVAGCAHRRGEHPTLRVGHPGGFVHRPVPMALRFGPVIAATRCLTRPRSPHKSRKRPKKEGGRLAPSSFELLTTVGFNKDYLSNLQSPTGAGPTADTQFIRYAISAPSGTPPLLFTSAL